IASGPPIETPMVEPSGAAFATASVPILPLAPDLLSTMNVVAGYFLPSPSETRRATVSGVEPGPNGTMMCTVFPGQGCSGFAVACGSAAGAGEGVAAGAAAGA